MGNKRQWFKDTFNRGLRRRKSVLSFDKASSSKTNAPRTNESEATNDAAIATLEDTNNGNTQPTLPGEQRDRSGDNLSQASTLGAPAECAAGPSHVSPIQISVPSFGGPYGLDGAGEGNSSQQPNAQVNMLGVGTSYGFGGVGGVNGTEQSGERRDRNGDYWDRNRSAQAGSPGAFSESTVASRQVSPYRLFTEGIVASDRLSPAAGMSDPEPEWDGRLDESDILPPTHRNSAGRNSIHAEYLRTLDSSPATASQQHGGSTSKEGSTACRSMPNKQHRDGNNDDDEDREETSNGTKRLTGFSNSGPQTSNCVTPSNPVVDSQPNGGEKSNEHPTQHDGGKQSDGPSTPNEQSPPNGHSISNALSIQQSSGKKSKRKKKRGPPAGSRQSRLPIGSVFRDKKDDDEEFEETRKGVGRLTGSSRGAAKASLFIPPNSAVSNRAGPADADGQEVANVGQGMKPEISFTHNNIGGITPGPDSNEQEELEPCLRHPASTLPGRRIISHFGEYFVPSPLTPPHTPGSKQVLAHSPLENQQYKSARVLEHKHGSSLSNDESVKESQQASGIKLEVSDASLVDWIDLQHMPTADAYEHALLKGTIMNIEADLRVPFKIVNAGADLPVDTSCSNVKDNSHEGLDMANEMDLSSSKWQRPNDPYHARLWRFAGEIEKLSAPPPYSPGQFEITVKEVSPED